MNRDNSRNRQRLGALARILITSLVFLSMATATRAGDKSSKDAAARAQALALFQKALAVSDIRAPGSPPFEMQGTIDVREAGGAKLATGTYLLKWAAPDKWREEIHFPNYFRIRVGGHNEYWLLRSIDYETLPVYVFSETFDFARTLRGKLSAPGWAGQHKFNLKSKKVDDRRTECVVVSADKNLPAEGYCFDDEQATLLRIENSYLGFGFGFDAVEFGGFNSLGNNLYPGSMSLLDGRRAIEEFHLTQISPLGSLIDSEFAPPSGATVYADCPAGSPGALQVLSQPKPKFRSGIEPSDLAANGIVGLYSVLGADAVQHNFKVLGHASKNLTDSLMETLRDTRYKPATCNGSPQPVELMTSMTFRYYPN